MLYISGDLDGALECAERALEIAELVDVPEAFVMALDTRGCALAARGRRDEAELIYHGALRFANQRNVSADRVQPLEANLAATLEELDQLDDSLEHYKLGESLARRLGDRVGAVGARLTSGQVLIELGRWDEFAAMCNDYLENDAPELKDAKMLSSFVVGIVWILLWRGEIGAARAVLSDRAESFELARTEMRGIITAARAAVATADGRAVEGLAGAELGLRSCLDQSFPVVACLNLIEAADAAFALGRDDKVEELIDLVRLHYRPGRQRAIDAHIQRWRAALAAHRGDDVEVAAHFALALEGFAALTRPFWLAVTQLEFAEWLLHNERDSEAAELLIRARSAFTSLGARPWIERVDNAARTTGVVAAVAARPAV